MYSRSTILGLQPFEPKRRLALPHQGGVIELYVLDGQAYLPPAPRSGPRRVINSVHFGGWVGSFECSELVIPVECVAQMDGGFERTALETVFRLIPAGPHHCYTAEIVAVSFDGCRTFFSNDRCTLPQEYGE